MCAPHEEQKESGCEYKTQTTVPLADGPLAAALWGREMDSADTIAGMLEAIISSRSLEKQQYSSS